MGTIELERQILLLRQQIDLEESNYKYALELHKDYNTLRSVREHLRKLKDRLKALVNG